MAKLTKKIAVGTLIGVVTGFVAGILTAPKSGKETRKDIKNAASDSVVAAEKQLKKIHTQLNQTINEAKSKISSATGKSRKNIQDAINKAQKAKEKARVLLSAIHEGDAEDGDLKQAVNQASDALKHIKTYIKKPL